MIEIFVQSRYQIDRKKIRERVMSFLKKLGVDPVSYTVSIAIVGDRKMEQIHKQFSHKNGTTPVLSFPLSQGEPRVARRIDRTYAENIQHAMGANQPTVLGEIVISYPQALIYAADENKLVDVKIGEFVEHGLTKLLTTT